MTAKYSKNTQSTISKIIHILNGDALAERFPSSLQGEYIVFRELLMDGPVLEDLGPDFYKQRAQYIEELIQAPADYIKLVQPELEKLKSLRRGAVVYLWFEYDLFCQVNYWYCIHWLQRYNEDVKLYWVRPQDYNWLGFGAYDPDGLVELYDEAKLLTDEELRQIKKIRECYRTRAYDQLTQFISTEGLDKITKKILEADRDRLENAEGIVSLHKIVAEIKVEAKDDFGPAFRLFSERYGHYGLGDLQFRRLYNQC